MAITTSKGSYQDYAYTGGMQSVTIPHDGIYKFEVWGAGGSNSALHGSGNYGNNYNTNGKGGYSVGYKLCKKGEVYYICVGGCNIPITAAEEETPVGAAARRTSPRRRAS